MRAFPSSPGHTPHPTPGDERVHAVHRVGLLATAAALIFSVAVVFSPAGATAATASIAPENASARFAILESAAAQPDPSAIPADFAAEAGYRPVMEDGLLVNPGGDCSSPISLPREFTLACKAHDFGYDLLRYADKHGQPLGPWARQTVDAALEQRMHESCSTRPDALARVQCQVMASIATTAVDLNSIRQDYGVPVYEPFFDSSDDSSSPSTRILESLGLAGLAAAFAAAAIVFRRRRARRAQLTQEVQR
ncbi:hypothetical protein AB0N05_04965 [Nocardia sp. NPDC051030]|uniref:hypothetical protein n=1 Tax=Nocardia sp. NPDC051030 TaxID=3155162 RepID=UPI0034335591